VWSITVHLDESDYKLLIYLVKLYISMNLCAQITDLSNQAAHFDESVCLITVYLDESELANSVK
jgi:hypothetical protein